jgi:hypothetical protein
MLYATRAFAYLSSPQPSNSSPAPTAPTLPHRPRHPPAPPAMNHPRSTKPGLPPPISFSSPPHQGSPGSNCRNGHSSSVGLPRTLPAQPVFVPCHRPSPPLPPLPDPERTRRGRRGSSVLEPPTSKAAAPPTQLVPLQQEIVPPQQGSPLLPDSTHVQSRTCIPTE